MRKLPSRPRMPGALRWGGIWVRREPDIVSIIVITLVQAATFGILGGFRAALAGYDQPVHLAGALALGGMLAGPLSAWLLFSTPGTGGGITGWTGPAHYVVIGLACAVIGGTGAVVQWGWPLWTAPLVALAGHVSGILVASLWALLLIFLLRLMGVAIEEDPATQALPGRVGGKQDR